MSTTHPVTGVVRIGEDDGRAALLVDGVVQSISPEDVAERGGYWSAMVPALPVRRALILGLGGGTLAHRLVDRWGPGLEIVGVDDDLAVLETARAAGWLALPQLRVVEMDAFAYLSACRERFDYVALDLYRADAFAGRVLTRPVLRGVRDLLDPPGQVAVNVFADARTDRRVARIARVFRVERLEPAGSNLVVHARRS